jgi:hypothetical protein
VVYTSPFFKRGVVNDYTPAADGVYEWELTDNPLAAVWLTVKGPQTAIDMCIDDIMASITSLDVWMGAFNVAHYAHSIDGLMMNCKLKGAWPYLVSSNQTATYITGVTFPIMFGAPYLNPQMCLPKSLDNRKRLVLGVDIATAAISALKLDIAEVIMPGASPIAAIKQEEVNVAAKGTGDNDVWLQRNWDLLKLMIRSPTVTATTAYTSTIERAGLEIDDVYYGYEGVPWEILHGELMDELPGPGAIENHQHLSVGATSETGMAHGLDHWSKNYGQMDFFYNYDLKWKAPLKDSSTAKLKYNAGVDEAWRFVEASYVMANRL